MRLISHRGNLYKADHTRDNLPSCVAQVLAQGLDCEIDCWLMPSGWFLGHDGPAYPIKFDFLFRKGLWVHCKNLAALDRVVRYKSQINSFWHQSDEYTVTTWGFLWCFPRAAKTKRCIAVCPEQWGCIDSGVEIGGVCSDYIAEWVGKGGYRGTET